MNERIRELLSQVGVHYEVMPKDTVYEKFAELIIAECARVAARTECPYTDKILKQHARPWDMACVAAAEDIRLHFGVER